nr:hypothetical protein [uncultured Mucilaginibacter sp.]
MYETVSVDEAIKKGQRVVNIPVVVIMLGMWGLCIFLGTSTDAPVWLVIMCAILSFVLAWLYWSLAITQWRLWAYENIRNVQELKARAISGQLIWPDGSMFEKTEIRTAAQKEKLDFFSKKLNKPDVFIEDYSIGAETLIYYALKTSILTAIIGVAMVAGAIYFLLNNFEVWLGVILALAGTYTAFTGYKQVKNRNPQIIISNEGLETAKTPFYSWDKIHNESAKLVGYGDNATSLLIYDCPSGHQEIDIAEFDISRDKLYSFLIFYRRRYNKNKHKNI